MTICAIVDYAKSIASMSVFGFAGAKGLGADRLYDGPFEVAKLGRSGFVSSLIDWRTHGGHCTEPTRVSMLDGLSFGFRREFLAKIGGWKWFPLPHHGYDLSMSCMAARHGGEIWCLPIECRHLGGQTACQPPFQEWVIPQFGSELELHRRAHEYTYREFSDVLPLRVS